MSPPIYMTVGGATSHQQHYEKAKPKKEGVSSQAEASPPPAQSDRYLP